MIQIPIDHKLNEKLTQSWWTEYSSLKLNQPFAMWAQLKYRAKIIKNVPDCKYVFEFKTTEDADNFIRDFNIK